MSPKLGLSEEQRVGVIEVLNRVLADEHVLYTKLRNYHWNVVGPQFHALHEFFENQYDEVKLIGDEVAERARAHGGKAIGTLKEFSDWSRLEERPNDYPSAHKMVSNLVEDHETMVRNLREDAKKCSEEYNDVGTEDLLVGLLQKHEQMAWMLRSFIEGEGV
ncbi:MAG: DNA starvation/stationary phase protection protein [Anaerolineae bacterium]|nr:DNA starvation/stationary phase protection protein [Anaerolineae bacterium]